MEDNIKQKELLGKIEDLRFDSRGLIPVIAQDYKTKQVLMLAWANLQSLELSLNSGYATYFSRSRNEIWQKGKTSGNLQKIVEIYSDCDQDSLIFIVNQIGSACHTGKKSCFFHKISNNK
jgi:phosphoribosyl-AMP cyclohydrolase